MTAFLFICHSVSIVTLKEICYSPY